MEYTKEFEKALNDYINLRFNQDECSGFMDGFLKGWEAMKDTTKRATKTE